MEWLKKVKWLRNKVAADMIHIDLLYGRYPIRGVRIEAIDWVLSGPIREIRLRTYIATLCHPENWENILLSQS